MSCWPAAPSRRGTPAAAPAWSAYPAPPAAQPHTGTAEPPKCSHSVPRNRGPALRLAGAWQGTHASVETCPTHTNTLLQRTRLKQRSPPNQVMMQRPLSGEQEGHVCKCIPVQVMSDVNVALSSRQKKHHQSVLQMALKFQSLRN